MGVSISRFSTCPSSPTITTSALPGATATNSTCLRTVSCLAATRRPAQRDRPDSIVVACVRTSSMPRPVPLMRASIGDALVRAPARQSPAGRRRTGAAPSPSAPGRRWYAAHRAGPSPPGRPSHCGSRPATARSAGAGKACANPPARPRSGTPPPDGGNTSRGRSLRPLVEFLGWLPSKSLIQLNIFERPWCCLHSPIPTAR